MSDESKVPDDVEAGGSAPSVTRGGDSRSAAVFPFPAGNARAQGSPSPREPSSSVPEEGDYDANFRAANTPYGAQGPADVASVGSNPAREESDSARVLTPGHAEYSSARASTPITSTGPEVNISGDSTSQLMGDLGTFNDSNQIMNVSDEDLTLEQAKMQLGLYKQQIQVRDDMLVNLTPQGSPIFARGLKTFSLRTRSPIMDGAGSQMRILSSDHSEEASLETISRLPSSPNRDMQRAREEVDVIVETHDEDGMDTTIGPANTIKLVAETVQEPAVSGLSAEAQHTVNLSKCWGVSPLSVTPAQESARSHALDTGIIDREGEHQSESEANQTAQDEEEIDEDDYDEHHDHDASRSFASTQEEIGDGLGDDNDGDVEQSATTDASMDVAEVTVGSGPTVASRRPQASALALKSDVRNARRKRRAAAIERAGEDPCNKLVLDGWLFAHASKRRRTIDRIRESNPSYDSDEYSSSECEVTLDPGHVCPGHSDGAKPLGDQGSGNVDPDPRSSGADNPDELNTLGRVWNFKRETHEKRCVRDEDTVLPRSFSNATPLRIPHTKHGLYSQGAGGFVKYKKLGREGGKGSGRLCARNMLLSSAIPHATVSKLKDRKQEQGYYCPSCPDPEDLRGYSQRLAYPLKLRYPTKNVMDNHFHCYHYPYVRETVCKFETNGEECGFRLIGWEDANLHGQMAHKLKPDACKEHMAERAVDNHSALNRYYIPIASWPKVSEKLCPWFITPAQFNDYSQANAKPVTPNRQIRFQSVKGMGESAIGGPATGKRAFTDYVKDVQSSQRKSRKVDPDPSQTSLVDSRNPQGQRAAVSSHIPRSSSNESKSRSSSAQGAKAAQTGKPSEDSKRDARRKKKKHSSSKAKKTQTSSATASGSESGSLGPSFAQQSTVAATAPTSTSAPATSSHYVIPKVQKTSGKQLKNVGTMEPPKSAPKPDARKPAVASSDGVSPDLRATVLLKRLPESKEDKKMDVNTNVQPSLLSLSPSVDDGYNYSGSPIEPVVSRSNTSVKDGTRPKTTGHVASETVTRASSPQDENPDEFTFDPTKVIGARLGMEGNVSFSLHMGCKGERVEITDSLGNPIKLGNSSAGSNYAFRHGTARPIGTSEEMRADPSANRVHNATRYYASINEPVNAMMANIANLDAIYKMCDKIKYASESVFAGGMHSGQSTAQVDHTEQMKGSRYQYMELERRLADYERRVEQAATDRRLSEMHIVQLEKKNSGLQRSANESEARYQQLLESGGTGIEGAQSSATLSQIAGLQQKVNDGLRCIRELNAEAEASQGRGGKSARGKGFSHPLPALPQALLPRIDPVYHLGTIMVPYLRTLETEDAAVILEHLIVAIEHAGLTVPTWLRVMGDPRREGDKLPTPRGPQRKT